MPYALSGTDGSYEKAQNVQKVGHETKLDILEAAMEK
jgi:hypothetical protein